jgi:hypothetical protein
MKMKKLSIFLFFLSLSQLGFSQVGINTTNPDAQLDIKSSNQATPANTDGILIPKIDAFPLTNPTAAQNSMMVYLTTVSAGKQPGFYYWDNGSNIWKEFGGGASNWTLTGTNLVNNNTGNVGIGTGATIPSSLLTVKKDGIGFTQEDISGVSKIGFFTNGGGAWLQTHSDTDLKFATNDGATQMTLQKGTGNLGINITNPSEKLDVAGKIKTTNLQVTAGATAGNVLTSDATGNATWQAPSSSNAWNIAGNSNINPNINFIGTTNSIEVYFKFNNEKSGVIGASDTAFGHKSLGAYSLSNENSAFGVLAMGSTGLSGNQNTAIGNKSMQNINSGSKNVALGFESLNGSLVPANNIGDSNTAIGFQTLHKNSSGDFNVANGFVALFKNTTGNLNTANGSASMYNNTSGYENTANGAGSLYTNATGFQNVALGLDAMYFNTTGSKNNASGYRSLYNNTVGTDNVVTGFEAMRANTSASKNVAIGNQALFKQNFTNSGAVYDSDNVAIGYGSLYNTNGTTNINGKNNIGLGTYALANNGIGNSNIAIGSSALGGAQTAGGAMTGNGNIAIGSAAMKSLSSGTSNIALGSSNLGSNTTGFENVSIGKDALFYSQEQSGGTVIGTRAMQNYGLTASIGTNNNVAIGFESLQGTSAGTIYTQNTAVGYQTLTENLSGNANTAIGYQALFSNTTGSFNTTLGNGALQTNVSGSNNIAIGYQAGFSETGGNKLYIENSSSTTPLIYGEFNNNLLRFHGNLEIDNITTSDNKMQLVNKNNYIHGIGNQILGSGGDDFLLSSKEGANENAGVYGDGNAVSIWSAGDANGGQSAALVYFMDEDAFDSSNTNPYDASSILPNPIALKSYISPAGAYFQVSDKNKKENIAKIENSLEKINQISGYTYQFKLASEEIKKGDKPIKSAGVLAQEVEKILPEAIQKNAAGDYFVDYAAITPLLIEAIKEQNTKIKSLETINAEILKRLEKLENK